MGDDHSAPVRVLLVSPLPPPIGGIARWTERIIARAHEDHRVSLVHVDSAVRERGVHDLTLTSRVRAGVSGTARLRRQVLRALAGRRPEVAHLTTSGGLGVLRDVVLTRILRRAGVPVVYHVRMGRLPSILARRDVESFVWRWLLGHVDTVLVLDQRSCQVVEEQVPAAQVLVVPNPVVSPPAGAQGSRPDGEGTAGPSVLFAGHLRTSKGVDDLLHAWRLLDTRGWTLSLAGQGDGNYPAALVDELGLGDSVTLMGELDRARMANVMASCDVFVLPSHTEGFPNAVVEAMAVGRAIIATDVGAVPEMLSAGAGVVTPSRDVEALAAHLRGLMADPARRAALGSAAAAKAAAEYSLDAVFARYVRIWTQLGRNREK